MRGFIPAKFRFFRLGKHFMEPSDYDEIPLCEILYFVRGTELLANTIDGDS
jgi:hypothetical protein